jgi:hypothetical protein
MKTIKDLKSFVLSVDRHTAFYKLKMLSYSSKRSVFHTTYSSLLELIEKKRKNIPGNNAWRAILHLVYGWPDVTPCKMCSEPTTFNKGRYNIYCSTKCLSNDPEMQSRRVPSVRESMEKHYGSWSSMVKRTKKKRTRTMFNRHGVSFYTEHRDFKRKARNTSRKHYGTDHPMQHQDVFERQQTSCMKRKELRINGKTFVGLQGYEPNAIRYLVSEGASVESITSHPRFEEQIVWFDNNGRKHVYFPDLLIGKRHIVEVKSSYTFNGTPKFVEANRKKRKACLERGFKFTFLVFSSDRSQRLLKRVTRD